MSIYEAVKHMNKQEFVDLIYLFYWKGIKDGRNMVDDTPWILSCMADWDITDIDRIE